MSVNINEENWKIIQEKYNNQFPQKNIPNEHIGCDLTTKHASSLTNGQLYIQVIMWKIYVNICCILQIR